MPDSELDHWVRHLEGICSFSSPRPADLNNDGILDVIFGAGSEEFAPTDMGIVALDGVTGELLWSNGAWDQVVGSPIFLDINSDNTPDIVIGGRAGQLFCNWMVVTARFILEILH